MEVLVQDIADRAKTSGRKELRNKRALRNDLAESSTAKSIFRGVMSERTATVSLAELVSVSPAFTRYLYSRAGQAEVKGGTANARTAQTSIYKALEKRRSGTTEYAVESGQISAVIN